MQWLNFLLVLLCPLMMLFCMKGMHKKNHCSKDGKHTSHTDSDQKLIHENKKLRDEIQQLKQSINHNDIA
ncbi:DUF2933 domain-containing protein [Bacillus sp. 3103sda1]|nr:DUF2933 domain-containing protein [Bacillus sp. 3103sda1]